MAMWRRWNERSGPQRFDSWTRAGLYVQFPVVLLLELTFAPGLRVRVPGLAVFLLLSVVQAGTCAALLRAGLSHYLARAPRPKRWLVASAVVLAAVGLLAGIAAYPTFTQAASAGFPVSAWVAVFIGAPLTIALTPVLHKSVLFIVVLVGAAAASELYLAMGGAGGFGQAFVGGIFYTFFIGVAVLTCRASAAQLRVMWELDRSRTVHARLSVAEERLRFARDLHDVLGRNLSLIAVKSELAAQLARRGDEEAADHMLEVRRVAHESLRDMRAVVSGYRTADLGSELVGAQAVLRAAGASCRIIGDAAALPPDVQAALGWVVREGTTNIIRHSDATTCVIELSVLDSPGNARTVTLRIDNDRVHCLEAGAAGHGLVGLGERLAGLGGAITAQRPRSGHFRLEATLPAAGGSAVLPEPDQPGTNAAAARPAL
jgi:two-component system, NarL family, sensor histidine kinase DesK